MVKQETRGISTWPLRAMVVGLALLLGLFLLPLLFLPGEEQIDSRPELPQPTATLPVGEPAVVPIPGWDEGQTLRLLKSDGKVEEITMADYLWGVVAAEMPASFHLEALKAQAVAARTYCLYQHTAAGDKHPGADVCTDFACCQAYLTKEQALVSWGGEAQRYGDKVTSAITDTDGLLCLYEGEPIDAVFFSSAAGKTSDAVAVWGSEIPYLSSVDSPEGEEVPGWRTMVTFTPAEFTARFLAYDPKADFTEDPARWFGDLKTDSSGMVTGVTIGGVTVTGNQVRSIFGLRSAHFTAAATEDTVTFWVTGYGHGVGMSQYGANAMAKEGKSFQEILEWYYSGAKVGEM